MTKSRIVLLGLLIGAIGAFFAFDLGRLLTLESFREQQAALEAFRATHPGRTAVVYMVVYVTVTGLSLPGAAILSLAGGALFGLLWGTVIVSVASTVGATLALLLGRFLFREVVERRFSGAMATLNEGIRKDGVLYLFMIRLVPIFPFFVVNLAMSLTAIRVVPFFFVSQLGMLPGTAIYVNAGTQLAGIESLVGILSPGVVGAFVLLGLFPLLATWIVRGVKRHRALRGWKRPRSFDRNLVVIGGGAAGLVTAYIGAAVKARVTLIEKGSMGGDCLNTGCVPSKALIRTAHFMHDVKRHPRLGVQHAEASVAWPDVMRRVRRVVDTIAPHDSPERYEGLGVEVIQAEARITGPWSVEVEGRVLTTRHIVVATGAEPAIPPIPGLDEVGYWTSETLWTLDDHPGRLLVLGGGPIGCELAQAFVRLGADVTLLERAPRILMGEDEDASAVVDEALREDGVRVITGAEVVAFRRIGEAKVAILSRGEPIAFDRLLVAVGRKARVEGFGLEAVGVTLTPEGRIETDAYLETRIPSIYAAGDCVGPHLFTHAASHQAWHAAVNALFWNPFKRFKVDTRFLPHATYTDPELARVGVSEADATARGIAFEVTRFDLAGSDRALADEAARGFVKVLTPPGKDRILGATVVGPRAGDLITQFTLAMKHGIGLNRILGTIHPYPTLMEANKSVAGVWKRAHAPAGALRWVERYHRWLRG
jgi:pyruvate/2-oxoglutarate dehydrogenase complex dihydrolipoamide dehydrogenase (E3) component/uncharacterized membrane protein YdjX (TVP38/TMEM64 family)